MSDVEGRIIGIEETMMPNGKQALLAALKVGMESRFWPAKNIDGITDADITKFQKVERGQPVDSLPKVIVSFESARTLDVKMVR